MKCLKVPISFQPGYNVTFFVPNRNSNLQVFSVSDQDPIRSKIVIFAKISDGMKFMITTRTLTGLLQRGLTEYDILKVADRCHNEISNRTFYEVLRKWFINFLQSIMMICVENASLYARSKKQLGMIN
jgi:hypothetical protein